VNQEAKDRLLGVFLAVLEGRDPRHHVMMLDGHECLEAHAVVTQTDALLKAQWRLMGAPMPEKGP